MKLKVLKTTVFIFLIILFQGQATSMDLDQKCYKNVQDYREDYIPDSGDRRFSLEERLVYLLKLPELCFDHDYIILFRANVLFEMQRYDEAITEIERGLKLKVKREGNLLYTKASFLRMLMHTKQGLDTSYSDIKNILNLAIASENDISPLIHLELAEVAVEQGEYDLALENIIKGIEIKKIYRFYTLGAIISERRGDYKMVGTMINDAVAIGGTQYLKEPDTVLSFTKALCASGDKGLAWAKTVVNNAQNVSDEQKKHPWIVEAAKLVGNDCKSKGPESN